MRCLKKMKIKITHLIVEFFGCRGHLSDAAFIKSSLQKAIKKTRLTELHSYSHRFVPSGVTAVIVLKESHLSIHTWPEHGYAAIDLFTCGSKKEALRACRSLREQFKPRRVRREEIHRGVPL